MKIFQAVLVFVFATVLLSGCSGCSFSGHRKPKSADTPVALTNTYDSMRAEFEFVYDEYKTFIEGVNKSDSVDGVDRHHFEFTDSLGLPRAIMFSSLFLPTLSRSCKAVTFLAFGSGYSVECFPGSPFVVKNVIPRASTLVTTDSLVLANVEELKVALLPLHQALSAARVARLKQMNSTRVNRETKISDMAKLVR